MNRESFRQIRKHCQSHARQMFEEFDRHKSVWADVAREFYPLGVAGLTKTVDSLADECLYDSGHRMFTSLPMDCLKKGASGFHGNLTSPARRWFRFRLPGFATDNGTTSTQQLDMLDRLTEAVEGVMDRSSIYSSLFKLYEHLLCFGFGAMVISADPRTVIRAQTLRVGTYALGVGADGMVDRLVRRFSWTAEQILREFGDDGATDEIRAAGEKGDIERRWTVCNLIEPNAVGFMRHYDSVARMLDLSEDMIYRSIYWLEDGGEDTPQSGVLAVSGFSIEPIVAPRFNVELGDVYGRGCGVDGVDLARMLQSFRYDEGWSTGLRHQPPILAPAEYKADGIRVSRGAVNYTRFGEQQAGMVVPIFPNLPDASDLRLSFQEMAMELRDIFFNSNFATIDALKNNPGVKTATEVDALIRENMERLGPVITNLDKELLDPLVSIVAKYTLQAGAAPLTAESLRDIGMLSAEYVSQIHLAQKRSSISSLLNWVQFVGSLAQMKPESLDKLDAYGAIEKYGDMLGVPAACVQDDDAVAAANASRAMMQQQMMAQQQQQIAAKTVRDIGSVPVDKDHAAGAIIRGLNGSVV